MSQSAAALRPLPARAPAAARPSLSVVRAPAVRPTGLRFVGLCLALVVTAMVSMLLVNTWRAENAYRAASLRSDAAALSAQEAGLRDDLAVRDNPAWLAQRAQSLGMLPAGSPAHLDAKTGQVTGVATLPDPRAALTVLTGTFADQVPPLVRADLRPTSRGLLSPAGTGADLVPPGAGASTASGETAPAAETATTPARPTAATPAARPTTARPAASPRPAAAARPTAAAPARTTAATSTTKPTPARATAPAGPTKKG